MVDEPRPLFSDRVYGGIALLLIALAVFFALRGGASDGATTTAVPTLRILEPSEPTLVTQPLTVRFDAGVVLQPGPMGWTAGGRHVHVRVGETELMSGGADLRPEGGTRYRWTLPRLPSGDERLQLYWSDAQHRTLRSGASQAVLIRIP